MSFIRDQQKVVDERVHLVDKDAARARELVEAAIDPESDVRRFVAPQDLLAAAQVYATLATRRY